MQMEWNSLVGLLFLRSNTLAGSARFWRSVSSKSQSLSILPSCIAPSITSELRRKEDLMPLQLHEVPNPAVERTCLRVTAHAPATFAPSACPHGPRRSGVSLTFWSLGD